MRKPALAALLPVALFAAAVAFAAASGGASSPETLREATLRTARAPSVRFALIAQIVKGQQPATLHVQGATAGNRVRVHLKVEDITAPDGTPLTGPSADERTDGAFLYLRSTLTRSQFGDLWVRESMQGLASGSAELRALRGVTPATLLHVLGRARDPFPDHRATTYRARVPYGDPIVRAALAGLEGGTEFRDLRLVVRVDREGLVRHIQLTGRSPDGRTTFTVLAALYGFGRPLTLTPPAPGTFVDFDAQRLST